VENAHCLGGAAEDIEDHLGAPLGALALGLDALAGVRRGGEAAGPPGGRDGVARRAELLDHDAARRSLVASLKVAGSVRAVAVGALDDQLHPTHGRAACAREAVRVGRGVVVGDEAGATARHKAAGAGAAAEACRQAGREEGFVSAEKDEHVQPGAWQAGTAGAKLCRKLALTVSGDRQQ
jgi:hypothetical protein